MASVKTVWGIDIGKCALKALKLRNLEGELRVEAFDVIEHPKILSQPDADRDQLIRNALDQFLARNNVADSKVVIAAPGQSGFTRFVKLPPVEPKQIPEIVRFEAEQQIPFNINEVIWRWQSFVDPDSPDIEVGIFAMKRTDVDDVLERFGEVGITVETVQMAPLALYNFMDYDAQATDEGANLLVDVGADKTDLVVADGPRIWTRTLQLGGNNFTEALVKGFKLSFNKAEKLKRTAATSKYARQIFQAMRPVFAELVQEIQRSIGYYTSLHRESRFKRVIGMGNGFRLPGLQKFLEQNLNIPVVRVDSFNKLSPSPAVNAPAFAENVPSFAVAYGLALQGLELTKIQTNLLPSEIARQRRWAKRRLWFAATAAVILALMGVITWRGYADKAAIAQTSPQLRQAEETVRASERLLADYNQVKGQDQAEKAKALKYLEMDGYRFYWPTVNYIISQAIARVATDQALMNAATVTELRQIDRGQRKVVQVDDLYAVYEANLGTLKDRHRTLDEALVAMQRSGAGAPAAGAGHSFEPIPMTPPPGAVIGGSPPPAAPPAAGDAPAVSGRGYLLYMEGTVCRRGREAIVFLSDIQNMVNAVSREYPSLKIVGSRVVRYTAGKPAGVTGDRLGERLAERPTVGVGDRTNLDPLTGEETNEDTKFVIGWVVAVENDGLDQYRQQAGGGGK